MVPHPQIDREKLRAAIRTLGDEYVFYMLDEAIDLLPEAKLAKIALRYIDPARLRPDSSAKGGLLADVTQFEQASLRGEYYEGFNVNSKNFMDKSKGTRAWISECHRLLDRCQADELIPESGGLTAASLGDTIASMMNRETAE